MQYIDLQITVTKNVDIQCTRRVSVITFIRYAQSPKIGMSNTLKALGARKTKGPTKDSQKQIHGA